LLNEGQCLKFRRLAIAWIACLLPLATAHAEPPAAGTANGVGTAFEMTFWQQVSGSDDPALLDAYLQQYPTGTFAPLARAKLAAIARRAAVPAAAPAALVPSVAPVAPVEDVPTPVAVVAPSSVVPASPAAPSPTIANPGLRAALANLQRPAVTTVPAPAPAPIAPSQAVPGLPPRPVLASVPTLTLPDHFCSAESRNAFYESTYKPALDVARRNNDDAAAYIQQLQQIYDGYGLGRDTEAMNRVAAESSAYQPVARDAYAVQSALVRQFDTLMAVPVSACG
jgi:hypothetical protein